MSELKGQISTPEAAMKYILGGKSFVTFRSLKSGDRFTYKVELAEKKTPNAPDLFFVNVLNGPDNWFNYKYIGLIKNGAFVFGGEKAKMSKDAPSVVGFTYCFGSLVKKQIAGFEVWHEGKCGRCGKKLTVPGSVAAGFGPECAEMVGAAIPDLKAPLTPGKIAKHIDNFPKKVNAPVKVNGQAAPQGNLDFSPRGILRNQLEEAVKASGSPVQGIDAEIRRRIAEYRAAAPENYYHDGSLDERQAFNNAYNKFRVELQKEGWQ